MYPSHREVKITRYRKNSFVCLFVVVVVVFNYFNILPEKLRSIIIKFRTSVHYLPVEIGHWDNTPLPEIYCILCNLNDIGDEFHYLFICDYLH